MFQIGGANCSICGSTGTNKSTCPCNPNATKPNWDKHPNWIKVCPEKKKTVTPKLVSVKKKKLMGPFEAKKYVSEYPAPKMYKELKKPTSEADWKEIEPGVWMDPNIKLVREGYGGPAIEMTLPPKIKSSFSIGDYVFGRESMGGGLKTNIIGKVVGTEKPRYSRYNYWVIQTLPTKERKVFKDTRPGAYHRTGGYGFARFVTSPEPDAKSVKILFSPSKPEDLEFWAIDPSWIEPNVGYQDSKSWLYSD